MAEDGGKRDRAKVSGDEDGGERDRAKVSGDEDGGERVLAKDPRGEADWLRNLPESLLWHVLLKLPTKDVVKTSVLSTQWRHLWRYVPGLDLDCRYFTGHSAVVGFIDRFLSLNNESSLIKFKIRYDSATDAKTDNANVTRWIDTVVKRNVQHLVVSWSEVEIPPSLYMCKSLVSLQLSDEAVLPNLEFVSLPSVKVIVLSLVKFANDMAFEKLISGCLVLERLTLYRSDNDNVKALRVRSQSLLRFIYHSTFEPVHKSDDLVFAIDTPKLEYLQLFGHLSSSYIIQNLSSLVEAEIQINSFYRNFFDPKDIEKRNVSKFLAGLSSVKNMIMAACSLEDIYPYSICERLPLFRNLSSLNVVFFDHSWEILQIFLESCPNLKSLVVESATFPLEAAIFPRESIVTKESKPWGLLSSLEYVKIESPFELDTVEMEFVSYLLESSPILKKLTLWLGKHYRKESVILRELLQIPRRSSSCQVVVL